MDILFATTRDQALLTMVIQEASEKAKENNKYFFGRTALQKTMYFLKILDIPMNYRFDIHHYGPFCQEILNDVDLLIADDVIKDESIEQRYSNYVLDVNAKTLINIFSELEKKRNIVKDLVQVFVPLKPEELELLSTLDYLYHWSKATGNSGPFKKKVTKRLQELKPDKFNAIEIEESYNLLVSAGLVEK